MRRSRLPELIDDPAIPEETLAAAHRDLLRIHRALGNVRALERALRRAGARSVLDIGCGHGGMMLELERRLGIDAVGVDARPPAAPDAGARILRCDAVREPLPRRDAAIAVYVLHHLTDDEAAALMRNAGRSCTHFLALETVRHPLPLALFRLFVAPLVHPVVKADGALSIRRSYTPRELRALAERAAAGSGARVRHWTAPGYIRQMVEIAWR